MAVEGRVGEMGGGVRVAEVKEGVRVVVVMAAEKVAEEWRRRRWRR